MPAENSSPQFLQIYVIDGNEEIQVNAQMGLVVGLHQNIVVGIQNKLHWVNVYIQEWQTAYQCALQNGLENCSISILENQQPPGEYVRRYNAPEIKEVRILMPNALVGQQDITLRERDNNLKRICEFHPAYDALQYPLLFPRGTHGWSL